MKVSTEPIENSQVALNVEMEAVEVDEYLEKAYNRLVRKVSIPGFRKGKAPRVILEQHVGKDTLFQEALERLIPEAYEKALEEQEIEAIARPEIELTQTEPVVFKAIVPLRPTVKLGDYKQIRLKSEPVEISDEDVDAMIEQLRHENAVLSPVDRPVEFGDIVTIAVEGESQGEPFVSRNDLVYEVATDSRVPLPGFAGKLVGMKKGGKRSFVLSYPPDYEMQELAGKEYSFEVTISEVKEKKLPEVDDEFAKSLGREGLASMRERISTNLKARGEEKARLEFEQKVVDTAVELSEVEYPPVLIDREIDRLLNEEARNFVEGARGLENYLRSINKAIDDHREELRPVASQRALRSLVLEKVAEAEKVEVSASEIDDEIEKMVKDAGEQAEGMRKLFNSSQAREPIKNFLVNRKTVERLVQIANGSA